MNCVNVIGNISTDINAIVTGNDLTVSKFNVAVNGVNENDTAFISCVAFGKTAEIIADHFQKGSKIGITGRLQTGSYDRKDGHKVYTTDVVIERITFCEKKTNSSSDTQKEQKQDKSKKYTSKK